MAEAEIAPTPDLDETAARLRASLKRCAEAKAAKESAEEEDKAARKEMLDLLNGEGLSSWGDGVRKAVIKHRQNSAPIIPQVLRREIGEELARFYIEERVDEAKLFRDLPHLKRNDKVVQTVSETVYVEIRADTPPSETGPAQG